MKYTRDGRDRKLNDLNKFIEEARIRLYNIHYELKQKGLPITAEILRDKFFGLEEREEPKTLLSVFQEDNDRCRESSIGKNFASITVCRYGCCKRYLADSSNKNTEKNIFLSKI